MTLVQLPPSLSFLQTHVWAPIRSNCIPKYYWVTASTVCSKEPKPTNTWLQLYSVKLIPDRKSWRRSYGRSIARALWQWRNWSISSSLFCCMSSCSHSICANILIPDILLSLWQKSGLRIHLCRLKERHLNMKIQAQLRHDLLRMMESGPQCLATFKMGNSSLPRSLPILPLLQNTTVCLKKLQTYASPCAALK